MLSQMNSTFGFNLESWEDKQTNQIYLWYVNIFKTK